MTGVITAWLAEMVILTYRSVKTGDASSNPVPHLPLPSEYVASFVIYGTLSIVPGRGQQVATAIGWGLVVATLLNLWDPATLTNKGGVAVTGGASTKQTSTSPVVSPAAPTATTR